MTQPSGSAASSQSSSLDPAGKSSPQHSALNGTVSRLQPTSPVHSSSVIELPEHAGASLNGSTQSSPCLKCLLVGSEFGSTQIRNRAARDSGRRVHGPARGELPYGLAARTIDGVHGAVTAADEHARRGNSRRRANGAACLESPSNSALAVEPPSACDARVRRGSAEHETHIDGARICHLSTSLAHADESCEQHATNEAEHRCTIPGRGSHTMRRVSGLVSEGAANHATVRRAGRWAR